MSAANCGIVINSDVFDVNKRLKEIDSGYFILYNTVKRRYEVHNNGQKGNTFCLVVPFDCLDARTIDYVWRTRVCNADMLMQQIEKDNMRLEKLEQDKQSEKIAEKISKEV